VRTAPWVATSAGSTALAAGVIIIIVVGAATGSTTSYLAGTVPGAPASAPPSLAASARSSPRSRPSTALASCRRTTSSPTERSRCPPSSPASRSPTSRSSRRRDFRQHRRRDRSSRRVRGVAHPTSSPPRKRRSGWRRSFVRPLDWAGRGSRGAHGAPSVERIGAQRSQAVAPGGNRKSLRMAGTSQFELSVLLADGMDRGLAEQGLTRPRAEVIWRLQRGGPATQRELSEALRCSPRNVTGLVDALEAAGLVTRSAHPTDGRHRRQPHAAWSENRKRLPGGLPGARFASSRRSLSRRPRRPHSRARAGAGQAARLERGDVREPGTKRRQPTGTEPRKDAPCSPGVAPATGATPTRCSGLPPCVVPPPRGRRPRRGCRCSSGARRGRRTSRPGRRRSDLPAFPQSSPRLRAPA
jgi:hypothetical protein